MYQPFRLILETDIVELTDPAGVVKITKALPKLATLLTQAVDELDMSLTTSQLRALLLYLDKLLMWNDAYNLTAITQPSEALVKHIIDCLAIVPHLPKGALLDIGTGAGLPAVIIAICQPERHCSALDSNQKKVRFIRQVASELGLDNVQPVAARIQMHSASYEVVTSRAFASLTDFVSLAAPRLKPQGQLCAMKGHAPEPAEIADLQSQWRVEVLPLTIPRLNESRHLVKLQRRS